jgi:tRNA pseudouridine38-40 synthase
MGRTLKITLEYDGTGYVGWQRQASGTSIQALIEDALGEIDGAPVAVAGAGRTDAGVHALGQVASFRIAHGMDVATLVRALNASLPPDVRVLVAEEAPERFHARFDARSKRYRYRITNGPVASAFEQRYAWHVAAPLDLDRMRVAAAPIVGRHDFAAFQASGSDVEDTIRTIHELALTCTAIPAATAGAPTPERPILIVEIAGDGFLRRMVRSIVGTLVEAGLGRRDPRSVGELLRTRDRAAAGVTAPARGLFLVQVEYGT